MHLISNSFITNMQWSFLRLFTVTLTVLPGIVIGSSCSTGYVKCDDGTGSCIHVKYVCDGSNHCTDGSDEDQQLCSIWSTSQHCGKSNMYCSGSCYNMWDGCGNYCSSSIRSGEMCKIVNNRKLPQLQIQNGLELDADTVEMLAKAVKSQISELGCPMLYVRVGNHCVSFFSLAQVPWPEARQFCQSIHGDLLTIDDIYLYTEILDYLREKGLSSDYWLGGRYDMDLNNWCWLDDTPMPSNSHYWALKYSSSCKTRTTGGKCFNYVQLPEQHTQGYCAAITYENYFYISDEECQLRKSPLCLTDIKQLPQDKIA